MDQPCGSPQPHAIRGCVCVSDPLRQRCRRSFSKLSRPAQYLPSQTLADPEISFIPASGIDREGKKLKGHENLTSIKGIGSLGVSILLSVIGDVRDFPDEGRMASYFGIVPRVHNSNGTEHSGRITKRGSKLGRTALVQCALIAKRYSPYLANYYERIRSRRGTGRAIIAVARKLLGIIYHTLKNNWVFEDFPKFVLREAIA